MPGPLTFEDDLLQHDEEITDNVEVDESLLDRDMDGNAAGRRLLNMQGRLSMWSNQLLVQEN